MKLKEKNSRKNMERVKKALIVFISWFHMRNVSSVFCHDIIYGDTLPLFSCFILVLNKQFDCIAYRHHIAPHNTYKTQQQQQ